MKRSSSFLRSSLILLSAAALAGCGDEEPAPAPPIELRSADAVVRVTLDPFELIILDAEGNLVLATTKGSGDGPHGAPAATVDEPFNKAQSIPGWDGYVANEAPWRRAGAAVARDVTADSATFFFQDDGLFLSLDVSVKGPRVRLGLSARDQPDPEAKSALNKSSMTFELGEDERFFGLGERFATVDHRGQSLYSYAEEGALGGGEGVPLSFQNPYPNGPSMTYFPVPFFLSNHGYGVHLDTTFRSELHLGSEGNDVWRAAVNAGHFDATVYVRKDPLAALSDYTEDTGRPPVPAQWVFGPRRRVNRGAQVNGVDEILMMRQRKIAVTAVDDAVHFLPALSHVGKEQQLMQWTTALHAAGYKAMAYNNPYVAQSSPSAAADYAYGLDHGFFQSDADGQPLLTSFISGSLLTVATIDLTSDDAAAWFRSLLKRTLTLGYDGWMHDFGEYTQRSAVLADGRHGDEVHNQFPVLSAKAAHDLLEQERPGDYLFFVRSGYSGTQKYVPVVWGGDAEATFDETQGLPSTVRAGLNLSMSGVPYWGSDMTGFKCLTAFPNDKEVFLRWVEFGAVSPIMMEQDACSNPLAKKTKWKLWNDEETILHYATYSQLHTRLQPYFLVLAKEAHETGKPLTLHPFLLHPGEAEALGVEDAYYLGPSLYASPVVARGATKKKTWLPPGRYVRFDDLTAFDGGKTVEVAAPLGRLPLFLVAGQILPMLDPSIDTLAPATDPTVVTLADVADRLDVRVALAAGDKAAMTLADGTVLEASRAAKDGGNPDGLMEVTGAEIADCAACFVATSEGDVDRLRVNGEVVTSEVITIEDVTLRVKGGPARRVRWDVLRLR